VRTFSSLAEARIVVIGAGVVGSAIAYRMSQAGANVTLIDRNGPGTGTSSASFAWLNAFRKPPRGYHRLSAASIRDHRELSDELDGDWLHLDGALVWCRRAEGDMTAVLEANERTLRSWGYRVEAVSPEIVMKDLEPDLRIDPN
jgi:glycine/D-amino acid oxidase-like deaminating enzyme